MNQILPVYAAKRPIHNQPFDCITVVLKSYQCIVGIVPFFWAKSFILLQFLVIPTIDAGHVYTATPNKMQGI